MQQSDIPTIDGSVDYAILKYTITKNRQIHQLWNMERNDKIFMRSMRSIFSSFENE